MTVLIDTDEVAEHERADRLHEVYGDQTPRRRVFVDGYPIRHRAEHVDLGPRVQLLRTAGSSIHILRTGTEVRQDAPEFVAIGFKHRGTGLVSIERDEMGLSAGHLNCVDMSSPYRLMHTSAHVHDVLILSNESVGVSVDTVRGARFALQSSPVYDLMATHLCRLFGTARALGPRPRLLTGQATIALARALLTTAAADKGGPEALADSLATQIEIYLQSHLGDHDLTMAQVARAHHISVRHLYNVWERAGHEEPPTRWLARRRLDQARHHLETNPALSISAVAHASGFADSSHFARRFRQTYGASPREWPRP